MPFKKNLVFLYIFTQKTSKWSPTYFTKNKNLNGQNSQNIAIFIPSLGLEIFKVARLRIPNSRRLVPQVTIRFHDFIGTSGAFWEKTSSNKKNMDNVSIQNSNDNLFSKPEKNRRIDFWVIYVSDSWTLLGLNSRDVATIHSKFHASRSFRSCQMYRIRLTLITSEEATIVVSKWTCTSTTCAVLMTTLKWLVLNPQSIGYLLGIWYGKNM